MNSNICLFDEDRNLCFEDMEWNVDSVFSGGSPTNSGFDLSKATQEFLEGGSVLQTSSGMVLPSTLLQQSGSNHISPRGIAENAEQENSYERAKESPTDAQPASPSTPGPVNHSERNSPQYECLQSGSVPEVQLGSGPEPTESSPGGRKNNAGKHLRETSSQRNTLTNVEPDESPFQANEEAVVHNGSQQENDLPREQLSSIGEDLGVVLRQEISYEANNGSNEFSGAEYGACNITSDPIESLVQLPDHVRYNGEFDPILHLQTMGTVADDDETTQDFLEFPIQVSHQHPPNMQTQATHQVDLASNAVTSHYEPSENYQIENVQRTSGMPTILDAPTFPQVHSGIPGQNKITPSPNMHLDNQVIQEVVQAYQSNIHPHLQVPLTSAYAPNGQAFTTYGANSQAPPSTAPLRTHRYLGWPRPTQGLPVRPSEGIVKRRGRKKGVRDPTKPPPTPRRRKPYTPRRKKTDQALGLSPNGTASDMLQWNYAEHAIAQSSVAAHNAGPSAQLGPQSRGRPASSVAPGDPPSIADEIQPASEPGQNSAYRQASPSAIPKTAPSNTPKAPGRVDSGRVTKRPGRKGGRINPETAHLSVEQRRSLRARRNRESAEKSRVRRKVQTAELEMSVAELREENKSLKGDALRLQAQLSSLSTEVTKNVETPVEQEQMLRERVPALLQALFVLRRAVNECPRTFRPHPHSPEIQLKIRR